MQRVLSENKLRHYYYYHKKVCKKAYFPIKLTNIWGKNRGEILASGSI